MYHYLIECQNGNCMESFYGFHTKDEAIKAFNSLINRPCADFISTTMIQGDFSEVSWRGYTYYGKRFTLAYDEQQREEE